MQLVALGLNHHTAPLAIREQLAFPAEQLADALRDLTDSRAAHEAAILSTCNRTEIYAGAENIDAVLHWLARNRGLDVDTLRPYLYLLDAEAAARHAFRVASGLDSMVLGETQIVGQIKDAVRAAEQCGALGVLLNTLFQKTFSAAKAVRSQTAIGANSVSMAAAGVKLALQIFPSIRELNVLFIGAGEMIELVATHFAAQVTSTASPVPVLGKGAVEKALKARRHKPMFMLDLAVPRDIEAEVGELADVFLYTVDDIAAIVDAGREERRAAAETAEGIIQEKTREFSQWLAGRDTVPVIRALQVEAERVRRHALEAAAKRLHKGEAPEDVLEFLSRQLTNKLLHPPLQALNSHHGQAKAELTDALARLYNLRPD